MRKTFAVLFISIIFLSCQKEKQATIEGSWREISVYYKDNSGIYYWSGAPRFPYFLRLETDGTYSGFSCVPAGHGTYQYNYSTRQLRFEDANGIVNLDTVSVLDDDYLILDHSRGGVVEFRQKFLRYKN